jgi:hypothetical protein
MRWTLLLMGLFITGCVQDRSPAAPAQPIDERFTLALEESATVPDTGVTVQFASVTGDSRCPADALCIQGGDAIVHVRVRDERSGISTYQLHTGDPARSSSAHRDFRLTLIELQPYPFSSRPITPEQYRATLGVTR